MIATAPELLRELEARGIAAGSASADAATERPADRPWYIGLLLGMAGWVAGMLLLVFMFLAFRPEAGMALLLVGIALIAAGWGLFAIDRERAFLPQLALALSVAGQVAALVGLGDFFRGAHDIAGVALAALVLQAVLVLAMPNALHRAMSALFATAAWALLVRYGLWDRSGFLSAPQSPQAPGLALLGWALAWPPVAGLLYYAIREEPRWMAAGRAAIVRPACTGLIVGLALGTLLSEPFAVFEWSSGAGAHSGWLAVWPLLSSIAALGALAAAFALGQRGLAAVCIGAALLHLSHFYYAMGATLVVKAAALAVMGIACLAAAHLLKREGPR